MKQSTAIALVLALLILAILGTSAAGYMRLVRHLDEAKVQTQAADARAKELEQQAADLNAEAAEARRIADERGREVSALRNQAAEFEKQIADLKSRVNNNQNVTTFWGDGLQQPQPVILDLGRDEAVRVQNEQVQAIRRLQLDLNGVATQLPLGVELGKEVKEAVVEKMLTPGGTGVNVGGTITVNGQTMRFGALPGVKAGDAAPKEDGAVAPKTETKPPVQEQEPRATNDPKSKYRLAEPPQAQPPKKELKEEF
ncbi:MAG TPA: hypothetical protein VKX17_22875 [Planctomycetota bacterium]|nr:hypothetical protein [Planctomycetota bacterium]